MYPHIGVNVPHPHMSHCHTITLSHPFPSRDEGYCVTPPTPPATPPSHQATPTLTNHTPSHTPRHRAQSAPAPPSHGVPRRLPPVPPEPSRPAPGSTRPTSLSRPALSQRGRWCLPRGTLWGVGSSTASSLAWTPCPI